TKWRPDGKAMRECRGHGKSIAKLWAKHDLTSPVLAPAISSSAPQVQPQPAVQVATQAVEEVVASNPSTEAHPADCQ
ncbi:anaerobic nitric oxide reductase flavorubredoxin, partial [Vibrio parahaemolyticus]|nr:anaerobic nitric oxide reductase flavorubredoxin [Vibrio parahaemolyticus]